MIAQKQTSPTLITAFKPVRKLSALTASKIPQTATLVMSHVVGKPVDPSNELLTKRKCSSMPLAMLADLCSSAEPVMLKSHKIMQSVTDHTEKEAPDKPLSLPS